MQYQWRGKMSRICLLSVALILMSQGYAASGEKEIPPMTKFSQNSATMNFYYCYSCGYRKAFEDYVNILSEKYPQIQVRGANFDPSGLYLYLSKGVFIVKMLLIVAIISQFDIFAYMNIAPTPAWWNLIIGNKMYACMMVFFVGNMLEQTLISSGAFEIFLNEVPVWSKLQTGRIPAPQELFQIIDSQLNLQFSDSVNDNPDFVK
ncbi:SELENOT family protein [Megaselia abdita]